MTTSEDKITTITDAKIKDLVDEMLRIKDWEPDVADDIIDFIRKQGWVHVIPGEPTAVGDVAVGRVNGTHDPAATWVRFRINPGHSWINPGGRICRWQDLEVHETRVATEIKASRA